MAAPSKGVYVEFNLEGVPQRVVEGTPPERGYILIAPGVVPTPDDEARVKNAREQFAGKASVSAPVTVPSKPARTL